MATGHLLHVRRGWKYLPTTCAPLLAHEETFRLERKQDPRCDEYHGGTAASLTGTQNYHGEDELV